MHVSVCAHHTGKVHIKVLAKYRDTWQSGRKDFIIFYTFYTVVPLFFFNFYFILEYS